MPAGNIFDMDCQQVIIWAERSAARSRCCCKPSRSITANRRSGDFAAGLLAKLSTSVAAPEAPNRSFFIGTRPVLNRKVFWDRLSALANGAPGAGRVLAVSGGVGKSYSRWPISHICDPTKNHARMVRVEANSGDALDVTAASLAHAIAFRMWGADTLDGSDDLAQMSRIGKAWSPPSCSDSRP